MEIEKRIIKYNDGAYSEIYHRKGDKYFCHREDGPAYIKYNKDGSIYHESYYINNNRLTKKEWEERYGWKLQLKGTPMEKIFLTSN